MLLVDTQPRRRSALAAALRRLGLAARAIHSPAAVEVLIGSHAFHAVLLARELTGHGGPLRLSSLLGIDPGLRLIIIDDRPSTDHAVNLLKGGAWGYLPYPGRRGALGRLLGAPAAETVAGDTAWQDMHRSRSPVMRKLIGDARLAAVSPLPVLIRGETGTGKGVMARMLHRLSPRSAGPFVTVDCAGLSPDMLMSELFGHVRGAFTDAVATRTGRIAGAEGGTLLLDEIGNLPPSVQAMLLRFLQDRSYEMVGDPRPLRADVRILSTTARDPAALMRAGRLREDLYYRLAVIDLELPPLRERSEDIVPLAEAVLTRAAVGPATPSLSADCRATLLAHAWPGNLHELGNEIRRAALLAVRPVITAGDLGPRLAPCTAERPRLGAPFPLQAVADEHIRRIVETSPTLERAASVLGIQLSTLWHRRRALHARDHPLARDAR